jgi:hypothetical protein
MINALGKYSVKLRGDIRSISRLHPGGAPPEPRRAIGGCDFHLEAAGELMIEIDGRFLERGLAGLSFARLSRILRVRRTRG